MFIIYVTYPYSSDLFQVFFLYLFGSFRKSPYLCTVARLAHEWAAGVTLIDEDVFRRLSLWLKNFANSNLTTGRWQRKCLRGTIIYLILIVSISYWRGLSALSILCEVGNAKAFESRMGRRTNTYAFFHSTNFQTKRARREAQQSVPSTVVRPNLREYSLT